MCGLTGIISFKLGGDFLAEDIERMNIAVSHRGPDDEGFLLVNDKNTEQFHGNDSVQKTLNAHISDAKNKKAAIALGHRRLSINDLSYLGHQPMNYLDRYWLLFNGEIYNYIEIRDELLTSGYVFKSHSDSEVILAAYDKWGVNCLQRFNGMWSIVIYDKKTGEIFLARDRFGVKPLYYYKDENYFIFASEIKAILNHSAVARIPNIDFCRNYLQKGDIEHEKFTAFKNIYHFDNGSFIKGKVSEFRSQNLKEEKFYSFQFTSKNEPFDEKKAQGYAESYLALLKDCVRLRLRSDVKVGSALSGGLDSSSVVYLVNQLLKEESKTEIQETFSSVYKTPGTEACDESRFIDQLSGFLNVRSNQIEPDVKDIIKEHEKMIWAMDNPPGNSLMSSWHTFKLVASTPVKVTLDGQGADEVQGGYLRYMVNYFAHLSFGEIKKQYSFFCKIPRAKNFIFAGVFFNVLRRLGLIGLVSSLMKTLGSLTSPGLTINEALFQDFNTSLSTLIHYSDRTSMAFSIESRMPFMDYRMVEFWFKIPSIYKLHNGWTKYIAREAMNTHLPDDVAWRKDKIGWAIPEDFWFNGPLKKEFDETIASSHFVNQIQKGLSPIGVLYIDRGLDYKMRLFNLAVWHRVFFETNP